MNRRRWLQMLVALSLIGAPALPVDAARVEIVLDVSGSMRGSTSGMSKMEAAKQAVRAAVEALDSSAVVALRLYGHRLPSEPAEQSCEDTELVIPFGPLDKHRFVAAVEAAQPLGQTPLAYSLERAAADFGELGDESAAVILVSDGEESCGGDPAAVACAFAERGIELTVHTVGFDVDATARAQLQAIAECTGGQYRDATDADELGESLRQLTQAGLVIDKQLDVSGEEIRGGNGFQTAVPITPGTYHLDHHQRQDEYDYFALDIAPGHLLRVSQTSHHTGVTIQGSSFTEGGQYGHSGAGVHLHAPDRTALSSHEVYGKSETATASMQVTAGQRGRYYILVGSSGSHASHVDGGAIHRASPITIEIIDQTDAGSGTDAGDTDREAVSIEPGAHRAWLQTSQDTDVFDFAAQATATYSLRVRPESASSSLSLTLADEDGVQIAGGQAPNDGAAVRLEGVRPVRNGRLFLTVAALGSRAAGPYTLELAAAGEAAPAVSTTPEGAEEGAASDRGDEGDRSPTRALPGGWVGCVPGLLFLLLLGVGAVLIVILIRRKRGTTS